MARLEIQITATNAELKKVLKDTNAELSRFAKGSFEIKPLSEYQAGLLKIKQAALELTKQKEADRKAAKAVTDEIKSQEKAQKAANAEANKKKPAQISNSQAEIDAYKKATQGSSLYTSAINSERVSRALVNTEAAKQAILNNTLTNSLNSATNSVNQQSVANNKNTLSKKQLAQALAEERLRQSESTRELKNNAKEMLNAKGSIDQRRAALERLTTAYGRLSVAERQSASGQRMSTIIKDLGAQINKLDPTKVQKVAAELKKIPEAVPSSGNGSMSQLFETIGGGALSALAPIALLTAALAALREVASHNIEISDSFADVRRTAKLTNDEVSKFAKDLVGLDTRTSLEGLLDIGFIGGRLGVVKKDLTDFTKQVDELAVVLKKEFPGGAEAVAENLGKIVTIYKITKNEGVSLGTALSKVGSNLLELAHAGPVTVKYLQDFTLGVAGTAASAKLAVPIISAYGAVLGESGQIASSAALSVTRLVSGLTTKTAKYAAIAQIADATLTVEKFTRIVNTDTKQALDLFFKGLKAGNPAATEFAARLGSVGITTGKVTNAVKILAENQDKLADRINKGTVAFEEGISVAHNFEIANDTLGASVDKLGNSIQNLTTNPNGNIALFFKGIIDNATKSVNALSILSDTIKGLATSPKKFIADSLLPGAASMQSDLEKNAERSAKISIKNLGDQKKSLDLLKREVKIRDVIATQFLEAKAIYKNIEDPTLADGSKFKEVEDRFKFQIALVKSLNNEYKRLYRDRASIEGDGSLIDQTDDVRTIDDIKADIKRVNDLKAPLDVASKKYKEYLKQLVGFKKELKIAQGQVTTPRSSVNKLTSADILERSGGGAGLTGLEGVDVEVEKVRQKYVKFYSDLDGLAKKSGANISKIEADRLGVQANEAKEISQIIISEKTRVQQEIDRINQAAGVKAAEGIQSEMLAIDKRYSEEIIKAQANADILATIQTAKLVEVQGVIDKYNQKRFEAEQTIIDKINDLNEKGFESNTRQTAKGTQKIDEQLRERLKLVEDHFKKLRKLYAANPLALTALGVAQNEVSGNISSNANSAKNPKLDLAGMFDQDFKSALDRFGSDFFQSIKNIGRTTEETMGQAIGRVGLQLFETFTSSINDVLTNQFKALFADAIKSGLSALSIGMKAAVAGLGLAGGIVSGVSKPTSSLGQGIGGALSGAAAGAAIGGPIGAGIGALAGLVGGLFGAKKARKEEARRQAELEEQKKQTALLERANALAYTASIIGRKTVNGVVTGVEVNEFGQLTTKISGNDIQLVLERANRSRQRGV